MSPPVVSMKSPTGPTVHGPRKNLSIFHSSVSQLTERGLLGFGPIQFLMDGWVLGDYTTQLYRN